MSAIKDDYNEFTKELSEDESPLQNKFLDQDAAFFGVQNEEIGAMDM